MRPCFGFQMRLDTWKERPWSPETRAQHRGTCKAHVSGQEGGSSTLQFLQSHLDNALHVLSCFFFRCFDGPESSVPEIHADL